MKLKLEWTIPSDNGSPITKYGFRRTGETFDDILLTDVEKSGATATAEVDRLHCRTSVQTYQLIAVNSRGEGAPASVMAQPNPNPPAPTDLTATAGNEQVTLNWTAPSYLDITDYQYQQNGAWIDVPGSDDETTSYTVPSLINGTPYTFMVRARNDGTPGAQSETADATPGAPLQTHADSRLRDGGYHPQMDRPQLHRYARPYRVPVPRYTRVMRPTAMPDWPGDDPSLTMDSGPWAATSATDPLDRELTLTVTDMDVLLEAGETYYFQVRAVNEHGNSPASNTRQRRRNRRRSRLEIRDRDVGQRRQRHRDGRQRRQCRG